LLQRFYDSDSGSVVIDGTNVNEYNLRWLRQHIGVVSQEPVLFNATIRENILLGRESSTDAEIHEAAKMANAHDFIMTLPEVCLFQFYFVRCIVRILLFRNMRHELVNEELLYQVDKSNELVKYKI
jgi:ABC-type multidrug transport system fused ATPase/permease subunit